jgi:hypothetical protein
MSTTLGLGVDCSPWVRRGLITAEIKQERERERACLSSLDVANLLSAPQGLSGCATSKTSMYTCYLSEQSTNVVLEGFGAYTLAAQPQ